MKGARACKHSKQYLLKCDLYDCTLSQSHKYCVFEHFQLMRRKSAQFSTNNFISFLLNQIASIETNDITTNSIQLNIFYVCLISRATKWIAAFLFEFKRLNANHTNFYPILTQIRCFRWKLHVKINILVKSILCLVPN